VVPSGTWATNQLKEGILFKKSTETGLGISRVWSKQGLLLYQINHALYFAPSLQDGHGQNENQLNSILSL
jgi:hypothetical protein